MIKCTFHHEFHFDKSPYVDDSSRLTVYGSDTFVAVPLLKLVQTHVNDCVVGIDIGRDRHPRSAEILQLKGGSLHRGLFHMGEMYN